MALTLAQRDALTQDATFRSRVRGAILHHADTILLTELASVANHNRRVVWATDSTRSVDALNIALEQMINGAVMRPLVDASGGAITDADLITAIGQLINAYA